MTATTLRAHARPTRADRLLLAVAAALDAHVASRMARRRIPNPAADAHDDARRTAAARIGLGMLPR